jgi:hypothetical protein
MRCRCVGNRGENIPQYFEVRVYKPTTRFALTVGEVYPVLGMELHRGFLYVLVPDNTERRWPQWMPNELFEFRMSEIPSDWHFRCYPNGSPQRQDGWVARWGYKLLVESDEHRDNLEERDPATLEVFASELQRAEHGLGGSPDRS